MLRAMVTSCQIEDSCVTGCGTCVFKLYNPCSDLYKCVHDIIVIKAAMNAARDLSQFLGGIRLICVHCDWGSCKTDASFDANLPTFLARSLYAAVTVRWLNVCTLGCTHDEEESLVA